MTVSSHLSRRVDRNRVNEIQPFDGSRKRFRVRVATDSAGSGEGKLYRKTSQDGIAPRATPLATEASEISGSGARFSHSP